MKISYRNTALGMLDDPKNFPFYLPEYETDLNEIQGQQFGESIRKGFIKDSSPFMNIQYVTRPFLEAFEKGREKMKEIVLQTPLDESGTLILPYANHTQTIFYFIISSGDKNDWSYQLLMIMFTKGRKLDEFGLDLCITMDKQGMDVKEAIWKGFIDQGRDLSWWAAWLFLFITFKKYVDVETKIVNANRKEKHLGEKYVNETNRKVEILDSTYFTTISRTEGFGVRGHFRWQPYGNGRDQKRLIWISDFTKHGYTRKAKILNNG